MLTFNKGSILTARGLPTPNLGVGQHNIHSTSEWITVQDLELATRLIVTLAQVWEQRS